MLSVEAGVEVIQYAAILWIQCEPALVLERKRPETPKKTARRTVDGVADEEEATDDVEEGSARGVLAVKVASLVACEGREADVLLRRGTLGELFGFSLPREERGSELGAA